MQAVLNLSIKTTVSLYEIVRLTVLPAYMIPDKSKRFFVLNGEYKDGNYSGYGSTVNGNNKELFIQRKK